MRETIPLRERPVDIALLAFFAFNLLFVSYVISLEQIVIDDPSHFAYPIWPPRFMVDLIHSYGRRFDPVLMARPTWYRVTVWWDALFFGPFYAVAIFAYLKGKEWIRVPSIVYASVMIALVSVIIAEEIAGTHAAPNPAFVVALNAPWIVVPLVILVRMAASPHPFTRRFGFPTRGA
ncbi:MAG: DUF2781 domain-containing protein [Candidatus Dadabacteria bacterium]|nr:MAG: DUF2781 domain-containing protein [Candidatus Dadabacteria bacterium]